MHKDLRKLVKAAEAQGFTTRTARTNHVQFFAPGERRACACFASTPSDKRSWLNSLADLKRAGFVLDRDGQAKGRRTA